MSPFLAWVDFTRARVLLALLSLRKNGGLLLVYLLLGISTKNVLKTEEAIISAKKMKTTTKKILTEGNKEILPVQSQFTLLFLEIIIGTKIPNSY